MKLVDIKVLDTIDNHNLRIKVTVEFKDDNKEADYEGQYNILTNTFEPEIENAWHNAKVQNCVEARKGLTIY